MFMLFTHGISVGAILCYFGRVGFEWLPFSILMLILLSVLIEIKYLNK